MVRRAERASPLDARTGIKSGDRVDQGRLKPFSLVQWRKEASECSGKQRLPGPGRPGEQHVVAARGSDDETSLRDVVPGDVLEPDLRITRRGDLRFGGGRHSREYLPERRQMWETSEAEPRDSRNDIVCVCWPE